MSPEVTFTDECLSSGELDLRRRAEIRRAVRRIAWPRPVRLVEVVRPLAGGRSGAFVAQIVVHQGNNRLSRVLKVDRAKVLTKEWAAFETLIQPDGNAFFAPIIAATPEVRAGAVTAAPVALVYDHVSQHAGAPGTAVSTLEDVVRAALRSDDVRFVVDLLNDLLPGIAAVLHDHHEVGDSHTSLRYLNAGLGPNITVLVDDRAPGILRHGSAGTAEMEAARIPDDELLERTLCGDASADITPGEHVLLTDLRIEPKGDALVAYGDGIVAEIHPARGIEIEIPQERLDGVAVHGLVVDTRGARHRARLADALKGLEGQPHADPFAALPQVLTEPLRGQVLSIGHGDLNPRNILLAGSRPYVIDYAKTADGLPRQADFCWLELGLLRDVLVDEEFVALMRLQRSLAFAGHLLDMGVDSQYVEDACAELSGLPSAFRVLYTVRRNGRRCHPVLAGQPWSSEYLRYLLLSAHRTVKWTGENVQSPAKLRASAAAAATATEWLDGANPFRFWDVSMLTEALDVVVSVVSLDCDDSVRLSARLVEALDTHGPLPTRSAVSVGTLSERLVRVRCAAAARELLSELAEDHAVHVDLMAEPGDRTAVELLAGIRIASLVGEPGTGKSAVVRELAYRLASGLSRFPVFVTDCLEPAALLAGTGLADVAQEAFVLGAVHLIVDRPERHELVKDWIGTTRLQYPRVRIVCCCGIDGGQVVRLRPLGLTEIHAFLWQSLVPAHCSTDDVDHLVWLLAEDPDWDQADLRLPSRLSLVAKYVRSNGLPEKLPRPHEITGTAEVSQAHDEHLAEAILDPGSEEEVRTNALANLVDHYVRTLNETRRRDIGRTLSSVLHRILAEQSPEPLRTAAADAIARTALPGFELFLGEQISSRQSWTVVRAAMAALESLGTALPRRVAESYHAARLARLDELDRTMPTLTVHQAIRDAQEERARLVSALVATEPLSWLARRRFAFGLARRVARQMDRVLTEVAAPAEWLSAIESGDSVEASVAAHQLFRHAPERADDVIALMNARSPRHRLLIAGEAVRHASAAGMDAAEHLIRQLVTVVEGDRLEGLAALLTELFFVRRQEGIRLARRAADSLAERCVAERHRWPWVIAMARTRGGFAELDSMLCRDSESVSAAVAALASVDFHRTGGTGPRYRFSEQARSRLLRMEPTVDWVLAVGAACLTEALPVVRSFAGTVGTEVVWRSSGVLGLIDQAELADVLIIAGYLAFRARQAGGLADEVAAAADMLATFDTRGMHHSVETGRRIGLSYLTST